MPLSLPSHPPRAISPPTAGRLRLGFVPLVHAAPLLAAQHLGLFAQHGLHVRLSPEVGWATIREKILGGELDAAQALAPMPLAMTLGLGSIRGACLTALILNLHGNTIVLSRKLWRQTAGQATALKGCRPTDGEPPTFGIVYPHSAQSFVLRQWLSQADLMPDVDYRLVVVPPQQMVAHLKAGHIDGACVGEPWGSLAVQSGIGVITALSADLAPGHPEKVLLVRRSFAESRHAEHSALAAALIEACTWCANPDHHEELIRILAGRDGIGASPDAIRPAITGRFDLGASRPALRPDALVFHGPGMHSPTPAQARWIATHLGVDPDPELLAAVYPTTPLALPPSTPAPAPAPATTPAHAPQLHAPLHA